MSVILSASGRLEVLQAALDSGPEALGREPTDAHAGIIGRIDRLQDTLNAVRDHISVKLGQAESVRVARDNTRGAAAMEQIRRLQTAVCELNGESQRDCPECKVVSASC